MTDESAGGSAALVRDPRLGVVLMVAVVGTLGSNIGSPALPGIASAFDVSPARVGLVMTAFTVPTIAAVPVTGALADLYGRRRVVIPSLVLFGVAGTAISAAPSFAAILGLRALQGIGFAGVMPLSVTILGDLYSGPTGSTAQGIRVTVNGLASGIVPAIVGMLVAVAWYYPFLLYVLAIPAAVTAYLLLPETGTAEGVGRSGLRAALGEYRRGLVEETSSLEIRLLIAGGFARDFARYALLTFVPLYAVNGLGGSPVAAGIAISMYGFVRVFVSPFAGWIVERASRRGALVLALFASGTGLLLIPVAPSIGALWAAVAVYGSGDALFAPVLKNAVTDLAARDHRAGVINGMQLLKSLAQSASPVAFGIVLSMAGFGPLFVLAGLVPLGYAALVTVGLR